jgi:hypothetical protein
LTDFENNLLIFNEVKYFKVIKIYEIWDYEHHEQYCPITKTGGLFTSYLNDALKKKQEASGYPDNCQTEEEKNAYISSYLLHEGKKYIN